MRIGSNPKKAAPELQSYGLHRLILPVYIPNQEGYFTQALDILKICLESVRLTKRPATAVTVVANGCCEPVLQFLAAEHQRAWLDQLVINAENRGKLDAIMGVARGSFEEVATFSDCDVFFRPGWDTAIESVFRAFPECGFVCPFPHPGGELEFTSAALLGTICRRELAFQKVAADADLEIFAKSIGRPAMFSAVAKLGQMVCVRGGITAAVGGAHFACSLRRPVLKETPQEPALQALGGGSETNWLDLPPDRLGYWRLGTLRAYVQHLGNHLEPWMFQDLNALRSTPTLAPSPTPELPPLRRHWTARLPYPVRARVAHRLGKYVRAQFQKRARQNQEPAKPQANAS